MCTGNNTQAHHFSLACSHRHHFRADSALLREQPRADTQGTSSYTLRINFERRERASKRLTRFLANTSLSSSPSPHHSMMASLLMRRVWAPRACAWGGRRCDHSARDEGRPVLAERAMDPACEDPTLERCRSLSTFAQLSCPLLRLDRETASIYMRNAGCRSTSRGISDLRFQI